MPADPQPRDIPHHLSPTSARRIFMMSFPGVAALGCNADVKRVEKDSDPARAAGIA